MSMVGFQSSPSPEAGRYAPSALCWFRAKGFNPRPARRPGATRRQQRGGPKEDVSILAQPGGRALRAAASPRRWRNRRFQSSPSPEAGRYFFTLGLTALQEVSILAQPGGRALHAPKHAMRAVSSVFQSSPSPEAGRYIRQQYLRVLQRKFQSSPSPEAGRYAS